MYKKLIQIPAKKVLTFKKGSGIISFVSKLMLMRHAEVSELADEQD